MATINSVGNAAGKVDVVVLEQNHVKQPDAVVAASSNLHGLFLQHAHAGCGLASVQHAGLGALQPLHVAVGHGGYAAHALHDVEHETLRLQQRAHTARDDHGNVALMDMGAVLHEYLDLHVGIKAAKYLLGYLDACQYAVLLDEQVALAHGVLRNATQGGVVAVANVFGKRQVDEPVNELLDIHGVIGSVEIDV